MFELLAFSITGSSLTNAVISDACARQKEIIYIEPISSNLCFSQIALPPKLSMLLIISRLRFVFPAPILEVYFFLNTIISGLKNPCFGIGQPANPKMVRAGYKYFDFNRITCL